MIFDICLYKFCSGKLSQYPTLEYAKEVISESHKLTFSLHGKRQLSLIKRGNAGKVLLYSIYNYVYNDQNDSLGICIVFYDKYPHNIDYMFKLCGTIIAEVIAEGKAFHFDSNGNIVSDKKGIEIHHSTLSKHKEKIKQILQNLESNIRTIPQNVYNSYEDQHIICQLSDNSWTLDEMFKTNNIVIVTEEIEDENINSMRSFIKKSNETVDDLNKQIKELKEQLKKSENKITRRDLNDSTLSQNILSPFTKYVRVTPSKSGKMLGSNQASTKRLKELEERQSRGEKKKRLDRDDIIVYSIIGCFILLFLFNSIAPWFIPSTWPKIALILTGLGSYFVIDAIDENSKRKHKGILGWLGAIAILFSTVLTIYGLYNHFSPDTEEKSKLTPTVKLEDVVPSKDEQGILAVTNTSFKEESHKTRKRGVTVNADYEIDNDNIALQICSKESVSFDELKMISESSKVSPGTKKKALTISNLYISVFNTTNHSLSHFKKLYSNGKRENSFSKEQIEILEWFFALSENEKKKWEDSDCTSNNFEEFKTNVERLIQNN